MIIPGDPFPPHLHNKQFCGIVWCYAGDIDKAEELLIENAGVKTFNPTNFANLSFNPT